MESEDVRLELRAGFDLAADLYDRTRPVCPAALFDDLIRLTELGPGDPVLEIGCGTGQATLPLAERGLRVTAVELGAELAELARKKLAGFPTVTVATSSFEAWTPDASPYSAVVAVNSLHWVDPELRYAKPAQVLKPGGYLAVGSCLWATPVDADPLFDQVQEDYRAVGLPGTLPPMPEKIRPSHLPADAQVYFEEVAARRYPFEVSFSAQDYVDNLATQSGIRQLGEEKARDFLERVSRRLAARARSDIVTSLVAVLTIGRAR
jgi:SAM-dependent methyltransferase